jgi:hypothetical protein
VHSRTRGMLKPEIRAKLPACGYADDIVLLADTVRDGECLLHHVERVGALFSLRVNCGKEKTAAMLFGGLNGEIHTVDGSLVPQVDRYKYLGWLAQRNSWLADWRRRRQLAFALMAEYRSVWRYATFRCRSHMFGAIVVPTLLYGASTYPWTRTTKMMITKTYCRLLRWAHNVRVDWDTFDHTPVEQLLPRSPFVTTLFTLQRLTELGVWLRDHGLGKRLHVVADVLHYMPTVARGTCPKKSLLNMARLGSWEELTDLVASPVRWQAHVHKCTLAEEGEVAEQIGARRETEGRRWRSWMTVRLVKERREVVEKYLAKKAKASAAE